MVTARARGHASSGGVPASQTLRLYFAQTSLLPLPGGFVFGDNNCSAVSSSCTGPRTIGGATVSMLASIPSFVSIAEKRRSMRSCASEATNGHRALASHFHLVRNVRGAFTHMHMYAHACAQGAHTCTCTRYFPRTVVTVWLWRGEGRASRLMSRSKTVAKASSCVGAEPLLLVGFLAGSAASPAEVLLLKLSEWHLCE